MLLRSSSTPILNTWLPLSKDSSPEPDLSFPLPRTRSITHLCPMSLTASLYSPSSSDESSGMSSRKLTRALSDTDLRETHKSFILPPTVPKRKPFAHSPNGLPPMPVKEEAEEEEEEEEEEEKRGSDSISSSLLLTSSGLDETVEGAKGCSVLGSKMKDMSSATLFSGDGFGCGGGGGICGGGRGGGGADDGDGESGFSDSNRGNNSTDSYYQKMIEGDPGNPLLLSNYARFLKEVRGDLVRAEEYCERAILAKPGDGHVLSLYADLIWQRHKDAQRAESYFEQAVRAAPSDCYVMGSYAKFLWDVEEEEDDEEKESKRSPLFAGMTTPQLPLTASS